MWSFTTFTVLSILSFFPYAFSLRILTKTQLFDMVQYIKSPETTPSMREKVNLILFERFQPLVHKMVYDFTKFHKRKCKHVSKTELFNYCCTGLFHAVRKYKGVQPFYPYASLYIRGQLYTCITNNHPISKKTKTHRRKRRLQIDQPYQNPYSTIYENAYLGTRTFITSPISQSPTRLQYHYIWERIHSLPLFVQRIFHYKYDYFLQIIRSNQDVAILMCTSEEYVRQMLRENIIRVIYNSTIEY